MSFPCINIHPCCFVASSDCQPAPRTTTRIDSQTFSVLFLGYFIASLCTTDSVSYVHKELGEIGDQHQISILSAIIESETSVPSLYLSRAGTLRELTAR